VGDDQGFQPITASQDSSGEPKPSKVSILDKDRQGEMVQQANDHDTNTITRNDSEPDVRRSVIKTGEHEPFAGALIRVVFPLSCGL
jgi:hypothetical protein